MKKLARIWVLCLTLATILTALHASAVVLDTKTVSLVLTEWSNSCVLNDYTFPELQASPVDQETAAVGESITCSFLRNSADIVTITMWDLSNDVGVVIPASGFNAQTSSGVVKWSIWNLEDGTYLSLASSQKIYSKLEDTIWVWTGILTLWWMVPGGTPGWTYTGVLEVILQTQNVEQSGSIGN